MRNVFIFLFLLFLISSCKSTREVINEEPFTDSCEDAIGYQNDSFLALSEIKEDTFLTNRYTRESLIFANAYGLLESIHEYEQLRKIEKERPSSDSVKIALLIKESRIDKTLDQAALELESVSNYIECHALHLWRAKADLGELNSTAQNRYTNAAVIVGAAAAIMVGGLIINGSDGDEKDWIGVAGGIAATFFAINSARVDKKARINHQKNVIYTIWQGDNSMGIFPSATWYLMNQPDLIALTSQPLTAYVKENWTSSQSILGSDENMGYMPTLLNEQGIYNEKMIQLRLDMLEDIESAIDHLLKTLYTINSEMQ